VTAGEPLPRPEAVAARGVASEFGREVPSGNERLRTDVHRPARGSARPALLLRTPYGTAEPALIRTARILARHGYAVVLQNVRGRYGSSGAFEAFNHEVEDGHATLEWLAAQPWCDGRIVGWGMSYSTYTAAALCARQPPGGISLAGMVSVTGMANPYRHFYRNGAFVLHWALPWYLLISGARSRGLDPLGLRAPALGPLAAVPRAVGGSAGLWHDWLRWRSESDEYWRRRDLVAALVDSRLPMLHVGGWYDFSIGSTVELYAAMAASGALGSQRLVVGPWEHNEVAEALLRGLAAGESGDEAGWLGSEMLGALRTWLGDEPLRPQPPVRVFLGDGATGAWRELEGWPPPTRLETWHLADGAEGEGRLTPASSDERRVVALEHDPDDPVPSLGGRCWAMPGWTSAGSLDQSRLAARRDVVAFSSPPLDSPLEICGQPRAVLWIERSGEAACDCCAKLVDVHPDGRRLWVADGVDRGSARSAGPYRGSEKVAIELGPAAHRFARGHRLSLEVAASSFPQFDRPRRRANLRLLHGREHASRLVLPEMAEHARYHAGVAKNQEGSR